MGQNGAKMRPRGAKMGPRGAKRGQDEAKMGPSWAQVAILSHLEANLEVVSNRKIIEDGLMLKNGAPLQRNAHF